MAKSVKKNFLYNLFYQVIIILIPLIATPYVSRVLGAENIGIYSYTLSIATYFVLFGMLGTTQYGQREIAYCAKDKAKRSKVFWEICVLKVLTFAVAGLTFLLCFVLPNEEYRIYYIILLIELVGNMLDILWFFQGMEEFKKVVFRNTLIRLVGFLLLFVFVKSPADLSIYLLIHCLSTLFGNGSLWFYLPKYVNMPRWVELKPLRHLKKTILLFIPQVATTVYTVLDKTMIGAMIVNKAEVGYYEQSQKIVKVLLAVVTSLGIVMAARIARHFAEGEHEKIREGLYKSFQLVYLLAFPIMFGLIAIADRFGPIFFGEGYAAVPLLMQVMSPILVLIGISNVIGIQYLLPTGQEKKFTWSVVAGAVMNFVMNLCLIPLMGTMGAVIGTVVAEFAVTAVQIYVVRKKIPVREIIVKSGWKYLVYSLMMFLVCLAVDTVAPEGIVGLVVISLAGAGMYILTLAVFKDPVISAAFLSVKKGRQRNQNR